MTLNSIKNRVDKLTNSKHKGIQVFTINEERDSPQKKAEIYRQIDEIKKQGEDPLLIIVRTLRGSRDLKRL